MMWVTVVKGGRSACFIPFYIHAVCLSRNLKVERQGLLEVLTAASEESLLRKELLHNAEKRSQIKRTYLFSSHWLSQWGCSREHREGVCVSIYFPSSLEAPFSPK
ncbi:hypothetical protein AMECASPLE_010480 [Ameca splendens]|uniref:Uncharacterized protein n=1 Tax=Ameca splendens TaxID=208324 RepID=A0ABV0YBE5_9TELE